MKFDILIEYYLSICNESDERSHTFSPDQQEFTSKFEKDIKGINGNPQLKKELKGFFEAWDSKQLTPRFEHKHTTKDVSLLSQLQNLNINATHIPLYVVEVRSRRPAIHLICTKIGNRVIWLRGFAGYDAYYNQLTQYR
jgi:hypothetical protein